MKDSWELNHTFLKRGERACYNHAPHLGRLDFWTKINRFQEKKIRIQKRGFSRIQQDSENRGVGDETQITINMDSLQILG